MRRLILLTILLAFVTPALVPPAAAAANGCAHHQPGHEVPVGIPVPGPYPNFLQSSCKSGLLFNSATPPCPLNLAPVALPGEYCGAILGVPPGATATCTAVAPNKETFFEALVLGLDMAPFDGNVFAPEPLTFEGVYPAPVHSASITNGGPLAARVIAYPTNVVGPGPILVECEIF